MIGHQHRFDAVAVGKLPEIFDRSVELRLLLACNCGHGEGILRPQFFAQRFGNIDHLIKIGDPAMQPGEDLLAAELRLTHHAQRDRDLFQCHRL